ncbi:MAG TPA: hypothetical protein ACQGQH_06320 [Xylella sp.]
MRELNQVEVEQVSGAGAWEDFSTGADIVFRFLKVGIGNIVEFLHGFYQSYNKTT